MAAALAAAIYDRLHVTHQWRRTNLSPRFWLIGGPIRPCADRKTNRTLQLRQDTPPNALARDRCWWQIYWLAGLSFRPPSQERERPQWQYWPKTLRLQLRGQPRRCEQGKPTHRVPF